MALFIYKQVFRDGCFKMQINNQWREFVNELFEELHKKTIFFNAN